jgi:hypothetical protein
MPQHQQLSILGQVTAEHQDNHAEHLPKARVNQVIEYSGGTVSGEAWPVIAARRIGFGYNGACNRQQAAPARIPEGEHEPS